MVHTKFQVMGLFVLEKKIIFFKVFIIYGHGGHVGHVTHVICINFHSHSPISFHISFDSELPNCFCEKRVLTLKSE